MAAIKVNDVVHIITEYAKSPGKFPEHIFWVIRTLWIWNATDSKKDCKKLLLEVHREHKHDWSLCVPKIGGKLLSLKPMMLHTQKQEWKSINQVRHLLIFLSHKPGECKGTAKCTLLMDIVTHSFSLTVSADDSTGAMKPFIFCPKFLLSSKTEQWMGIQFSWEQYLI